MFRGPVMTHRSDSLESVISRLEELRRSLTSHIIEGDAARILEDLSTRLSLLALVYTDYTEDLNGLARRLRLLSTFAQALHNQWRHIHSKRVFGRINYLDEHINSVIFELRNMVEEMRTKKVIRRIEVVRRIVF